MRRRHGATCVLMVLTALLIGGSARAEVGTIRFLESVPAETTLDLPDIAQAYTVWPQLIAAAQHSVSVASFYYSRIGDGGDAAAPAGTPDRLLPSIAALGDAAARGLRIQLLADAKFMKNYPEVPQLIAGLDGAETRIIDAKPLWGGILHAKYMLLDDDAFYVGSQNWDWRALDQIHELGVVIEEPELTRQLRQVYDLDWDLAAHPEHASTVAPVPSLHLFDIRSTPLKTPRGDLVAGVLAASPQRGLPAEVPWDLPLLVELIDAARDSVHLQLLSYSVTDRHGRLFDDLDRALRRAAVRRVDVKIIVSNWSKSKYSVPWLKSLAVLPHIEVRFTNIPEYSKGFIPFARVEHAKYLTTDGNGLWLGTANWGRDYFYESRNISVFLLGEGATAVPDRFFNLSWHSSYAEVLVPEAHYSPPRRR